jgi:ERCC4-type nuclease
MTLYIQSQEKKLIEACEKLGISYETRAFKVGDVMNDTGSFIAELKNSKDDFWSSMTDRRLYRQFREMVEQFNGSCYLFVPCGALKALAKERPANTNWIYSMYGEAENWGINFREFSDFKDLARKLVSLDKKIGAERKIRDTEPAKYASTIAERMISQLPGIGEKLAKNVLKECKSFDGFYADVHGDMNILDSIKGLSKKGKILDDVLREMRKLH